MNQAHGLYRLQATRWLWAVRWHATLQLCLREKQKALAYELHLMYVTINKVITAAWKTKHTRLLKIGMMQLSVLISAAVYLDPGTLAWFTTSNINLYVHISFAKMSVDQTRTKEIPKKHKLILSMISSIKQRISHK